ncbi:ribose-5-phosphate isomerase RpiA [Asticcacaulis sp. SL142]|uniref:ribose-5-phosphate isomerase RpiA n=1 Tax=Asticcacaulis sp. SL142 TaxID=2995155 RepID=UPI00226C7EDD|nr:ribose-5-phosphate isomerase RpiA [Asticcacaulis sp. SL142]WAC49127.1 ribose-5-phosphate isomerase RpiA [Asticcacaulis sp. SL142]
MSAETQKEQSGLAAIEYVKDGMKVGLGTGSTAAHFVKALADKVKAGMKLTLVSTSVQTTNLAQSLGLAILDINDVGTLDLCVDGADEIGPGLALIKGGGGALLREKLIWEQAKTCIVIADAAKHVKTLGAFALPIEVEPFAYKGTVNRICDVLAEFEIQKVPTLRKKNGQPFITDGANLIFDVPCGQIYDPTGLAAALKATTGVVDHGLFLDLAEFALLGTDDGVKVLEP